MLCNGSDEPPPPPDGSRRSPPGSTWEDAAVTSTSLTEAHRRLLAHRLRAIHSDLVLGLMPGSLVLALGRARVVLVVESAAAENAQVRGEVSALRYSVEGVLSPAEAERARTLVLE